MSLVHPAFLWGLLFLAIPIIVHLFNLRRYKKVFFTNTSILKTILTQTQKTSQLKKRLLLAARLLALLFIVFTFVQPFFSHKSSAINGNGQPIISIYIDNSFSMELPSKQVRAIDEAKQKALEIIKATQNQGLYQIITNDFKGNQLQLLPYQEAKDAIKNIEISSATRTSEEVWQKQLRTTSSNASERKLFYWLSDFQKNQFSAITNSDYPLTCIPIAHSKLQNIYIDTAYVLSPVIKLNQDIKIIYTLKKSKDDATDKSLITLVHNDAVKIRREVQWQENEKIIDTLSLKLITGNWQYLKLSVSDPSIAFDNDFYFSLFVQPKPFVSIVQGSGEQQFLSNALKADDNFDIHSFSSMSIPLDEIRQTNLIILNQLSSLGDVSSLNEWLKSNKNILLTLPSSLNPSLYNTALTSLGIQTIGQYNTTTAAIKQFNVQDPLFSNVFTQLDKLNDFPHFNNFYSLSGFSQRSKEVLISLDNGMPFLVKYTRPGEGTVYLFTAPINAANSDFVYSSIFAPLVYKLGASATSFQVNSYFIGSKSTLSIPIDKTKDDKVYKITSKELSVIPPQRKIGQVLNCSIDESIQQSGFYSLEDSRNNKLYELALNYRRDESSMEFLSPSEIKSTLNYQALTIDEGNAKYLENLKTFAGTNLWKLWLFLALLFLAVEMLIIKFWDKYYPKWINKN